MKLIVIFVVALCYRTVAGSVIVVRPTQPSTAVTKATENDVEKPYMHYFHVESDIKYRYATTLATTRIENPADVAQEVSFSAVLPETAFISRFNMEVDGKVYEAYVKEKEEAQKEYDQAVQNGQTAAQVALTARDSNRFTVSVNVEPNKAVIFNLTYEELLTRRLKTYSDVINLNPGQVVNDFSVTVRIEESSNIISLRVPALKLNEEMNVKNTNNALASLEMTSPTTAVVKFTPTPNQQMNVTENGIQGQFIVEYDVDRSTSGGEVLVNDGYFVHFFSPENLKSLNKHVTFVLDLSGSMMNRPIEQLREAMLAILDDLNNGDFFSIVLFSQTAQVWDPTITEDEMDQRLALVGTYSNEEGFPLPAVTPSVIAKVNKKNIKKAKTLVKKLQATASTDIYDGLMLALNIAKLNPKKLQNQAANGRNAEPIIVFLTDGLPNVHVSDVDTIVSDVTKANTKNSSIFSLALGNGADYNFLKKLSLQNSGFSRRIYEAADTALQLTDFYAEISSPLLADVQFEYTPDQIEDGTLTTPTFRRLFGGSELVVAGKLREDIDISLTGDVTAISIEGTITFTFEAIIIPYPPIILPQPVKHIPSNMERLWAYLTIEQLLDQDDALDYDHNNKNLSSPQKKHALDLALEYSFVTSLTSLVVVKPNESRAVDTQDASQTSSGFSGGGVGLGLMAIPIRRPIIQATTAPEARCLKAIHDVTWLAPNRTITVTTDSKGDVILQVAGANETNTAFESCTTPAGEAGFCRHLQYCVLNSIIDKKEDFDPYMCVIDSYVGVCCPDETIQECAAVDVSKSTIL